MLNKAEDVKNQYETSKALCTRISIHEKYSVNKQGFGNWLFSHYKLQSGMRVLELGCGTGEMWKQHIEELPTEIKIHLSDFSEGMIESTKVNLSKFPMFEFSTLDIQDIPFPDHQFDIIIANMMLYHVPNIPKALSEVKRVLKDNGVFYCATFGIHGICEYIEKLFSDVTFKDTTSTSFTLQNGAQILQTSFSNIVKDEYIDALEVSEVEDIIAYVHSLANFTGLEAIPENVLKDTLTSHMKNGILHVPKEYGMFIVKK